MNKSKAYLLSEKKHAGQFRRDGITPYFEHCKKVASVCSSIEKSNYIIDLCYCHDLIEDTNITLEELLSVGHYQSFVDDLMILTHNKMENYECYIRRIRNNIRYYLRLIKVADIVSNLTDSPTEEQIIKYYLALTILTS